MSNTDFDELFTKDKPVIFALDDYLGEVFPDQKLAKIEEVKDTCGRADARPPQRTPKERNRHGQIRRGRDWSMK